MIGFLHAPRKENILEYQLPDLGLLIIILASPLIYKQMLAAGRLLKEEVQNIPKTNSTIREKVEGIKGNKPTIG
jgi:hypothetical protein